MSATSVTPDWRNRCDSPETRRRTDHWESRPCAGENPCRALKKTGIAKADGLPARTRSADEHEAGGGRIVGGGHVRLSAHLADIRNEAVDKSGHEFQGWPPLGEKRAQMAIHAAHKPRGVIPHAGQGRVVDPRDAVEHPGRHHIVRLAEIAEPIFIHGAAGARCRASKPHAATPSIQVVRTFEVIVQMHDVGGEARCDAAAPILAQKLRRVERGHAQRFLDADAEMRDSNNGRPHPW